MSIVIAGLIASTVERRVLPNEQSTPVAEFRLAFTVSTGKDQSRHAEITVKLYGKASEFTFEQGNFVIVEGSLTVDKVSTPQGNRNIYGIDGQRIHEGVEYLTLNSVNVVGRLGNDPDIKYFESGTVKADFSIASNRTKQITDWYSISLWGKQADVAANYVRKGSQVGISGQLVCEWWNDRNSGEERSKFLVKGEKLTLLGGKRDEERQPVAAGNFDDIAF